MAFDSPYRSRLVRLRRGRALPLLSLHLTFFCPGRFYTRCPCRHRRWTASSSLHPPSPNDHRKSTSTTKDCAGTTALDSFTIASPPTFKSEFDRQSPFKSSIDATSLTTEDASPSSHLMTPSTQVSTSTPARVCASGSLLHLVTANLLWCNGRTMESLLSPPVTEWLGRALSSLIGLSDDTRWPDTPSDNPRLSRSTRSSRCRGVMVIRFPSRFRLRMDSLPHEPAFAGETGDRSA